MHGSSGMPSVYADCEVACVSMKGANRLASTSLTECLVFGAAAGRAAAGSAVKMESPSFGNPVQGEVMMEEKRIFDQILKHEQGERISSVRTEMQNGMEKHVGIYRDENSLKEGCRIIGDLKPRLSNAIVAEKDHVYNTELVAALELDFMLDVAETMPYSALKRRESRGANSRTDYTKRNEANFLKHSIP